MSKNFVDVEVPKIKLSKKEQQMKKELYMSVTDTDRSSKFKDFLLFP